MAFSLSLERILVAGVLGQALAWCQVPRLTNAIVLLELCKVADAFGEFCVEQLHVRSLWHLGYFSECLEVDVDMGCGAGSNGGHNWRWGFIHW